MQKTIVDEFLLIVILFLLLLIYYTMPPAAFGRVWIKNMTVEKDWQGALSPFMPSVVFPYR